MNPEQRAGHGGSHFPTEKFLTKAERVSETDTNNRLAGFVQRVQRRILFSRRRTVESNIDKEPIPAIDLGRAQGLGINRNKSAPLLAGRFGDELLKPRPQGANARRGHNGHFVSAVLRQGSHNRSQPNTGIDLGRNTRRAGLDHQG